MELTYFPPERFSDDSRENGANSYILEVKFGEDPLHRLQSVALLNYYQKPNLFNFKKTDSKITCFC